MSMFQRLGRKVERLKREMEAARDAESDRRCRECGASIHGERDVCPECGSDDVVAVGD